MSQPFSRNHTFNFESIQLFQCYFQYNIQETAWGPPCFPILIKRGKRRFHRGDALLKSPRSEGEGRRTKEFGQPWIHSKFEASLYYIRSRHKKANKRSLLDGFAGLQAKESVGSNSVGGASKGGPIDVLWIL